MNGSTIPKKLLLLATLCATTALDPVTAQAQERRVRIQLDSIQIRDEDDPLSNDEPYLIATKFRMQVRVSADGRAVTIVPGTLRVENFMSGHNNLGRRGDNWADEPNTYRIPDTVRRAAEEALPNEPGWVFGVVLTHMEEDGFSDSTANLLGRKIEETVRRTLAGMRFAAPDTRSITDALAKKIAGDLSRALRRVDVGGLVRGLASVADPDDFGGVNVVLTTTGPANRLFMFAGVPPATLEGALAGVREVTGPTNFTLRYPAGDLSGVPGSASFKGDHRVHGTVSVR